MRVFLKLFQVGGQGLGLKVEPFFKDMIYGLKYIEKAALKVPEESKCVPYEQVKETK